MSHTSIWRCARLDFPRGISGTYQTLSRGGRVLANGVVLFRGLVANAGAMAFRLEHEVPLAASLVNTLHFAITRRPVFQTTRAAAINVVDKNFSRLSQVLNLQISVLVVILPVHSYTSTFIVNISTK